MFGSSFDSLDGSFDFDFFFVLSLFCNAFLFFSCEPDCSSLDNDTSSFPIIPWSLSDIVSYPSDIFSLGVTLLEAATGLYAPRGGSEKYTHLRTGAIKLIKVDNVSGNIIHFRPSAYFSNYSQQFVDVVNSMIDPVPDHRPTACQLFEIASLMLRKK